jgi:hypothetical protein
LAFLEEKARSGRPPVLSKAVRAKVIALAATDAPEGYAQWTLRSLAKKVVALGYVENISHTMVAQILKEAE